MKWTAVALVLSTALAAATPAGVGAQGHPDLSGVWRLDLGESRMIGGGAGFPDEYELTWLVRHQEAEIYVGTSSDLRLRAVAYEIDRQVGYIIGAYGYGDEPSIPDRGMFIPVLRRGEDARWLIAADLDGAIRVDEDL